MVVKLFLIVSVPQSVNSLSCLRIFGALFIAKLRALFIYSIFSRTADVWAAEVIAQWQAQQQVAIDAGTLNKVFTQFTLLLQSVVKYQPQLW